jgi:hypothetical protein
MSNDRDDAEGRQETTPFGRPAGEQPDQRQGQPSGQPPSGQGPYGQPAWAQSQYGPPSYGQPGYGPPQYGQPAYGQPPYGQPPYGQPPYGQPPPARPGTVITAAVLGLVHAALGLLVTVSLLAGGALIDDLISLAESDPGIDAQVSNSEVNDARAALVGVALLALAWTVVMVWGSVLAIRGRSRVLLLVGASIAVVVSGLVFGVGLIGVLAAPDQPGQTSGVLFLLMPFLASLAMLVLLCLRSAGQFFAAHRQLRAYTAR